METKSTIIYRRFSNNMSKKKARKTSKKILLVLTVLTMIFSSFSTVFATGFGVGPPDGMVGDGPAYGTVQGNDTLFWVLTNDRPIWFFLGLSANFNGYKANGTAWRDQQGCFGGKGSNELVFWSHLIKVTDRAPMKFSSLDKFMKFSLDAENYNKCKGSDYTIIFANYVFYKSDAQLVSLLGTSAARGGYRTKAFASDHDLQLLSTAQKKLVTDFLNTNKHNQAYTSNGGKGYWLKKGITHNTDPVTANKYPRLIQICQNQLVEYPDPVYKPCVSGGRTYSHGQKIYGSWKNSASDDMRVRGIYSYQTQIDPVVPSQINQLDQEQLNEWKRTHKSQSLSPNFIRTAYATELDKIINEGLLDKIETLNPDAALQLFRSVKSRLETAKSKTKINQELELSSDNQKGFARGGAFTMSTRVKEVELQGQIGIQTRSVQKCVERKVDKVQPGLPYNAKHCSKKGAGNTCIITDTIGEWQSAGTEKRVKPSSNDILEVSYLSNGNPIPYSSRQFIHARCNQDGVQEIVESIGGSMMSNTVISSSGRSKLYNNAIQKPITGSAANRLFFYSADCSQLIKCTPDKTKAPSGSDARNNVRTAGKTDDLYGAQSGGKNTSIFQFFRDGQDHKIRNDVWVPTSNASNFNPSAKAKLTDVFLGSDGTPKNDGELLTVSKPKIDANKDSKTTTGELNETIIAGRWASEKNKPVELRHQYYYEPSISSVIIRTVNSQGVTKSITVNEPIVSVCSPAYNQDTEINSYSVNLPLHKFYTGEDLAVGGTVPLRVYFVKASAE